MQSITETLAAIHAGGAWVYPILALALLATLLIVDKALTYWRYTRLGREIVLLIETYGFDWLELEQKLNQLDSRHYFERFFRVILNNRNKPAWWVESRAADEASVIEKSLARGLWLLETIVTAAPLFGLLGTIAGMIGAFKLFGGSSAVDPGAVTGGVAEALISTALGIFVALLALFAFNYFSRQQATVLDEMERLGTRMIDHIRLDQGAATEHHHEAA